MIYFYIGAAVCLALIMIAQIFLIYAGIVSFKEFSGPTFGHQIVMSNIIRRIVTCTFVFIGSFFGFLGCLNLAGVI